MDTDSQDLQRDLTEAGEQVREQHPHPHSLPGSGLSQWADSAAITEAGKTGAQGGWREVGGETQQGEMLGISR